MYKFELGGGDGIGVTSNLYILKRNEFLPLHLIGGIVFLITSYIISRKNIGLMYRNPYRTYHVDFINKLFPIIRSGQNV